MKKGILFMLLGVFFCSCGSSLPKGKWKLVKAEIDGHSIPQEKGLTVEFLDSQVLFLRNDQVYDSSFIEVEGEGRLIMVDNSGVRDTFLFEESSSELILSKTTKGDYKMYMKR